MKIVQQTLKILLPLLLGGAILYWMYRGFDFQSIRHILLEEMNWTWMLLSFPFGILAQAFRGWRWRQTLEPVGETPRNSVAVNSIFLSYSPRRRVCPLWRVEALGWHILPEGFGHCGY
jgi:hypothetical protein